MTACISATSLRTPETRRAQKTKSKVMKFISRHFPLLTFALIGLSTTHAQDPLPSWNDTALKKAILAFVEKVTKEGSPDFVPPNDRIATFDNDGTLWAEQPMYFQM